MTSHPAKLIDTIGKLGGRLNIAESTSPIHTDPRPIAVPRPTTATGRAVIAMAVAAGVTTRANNNRVPTTCTAMVMTIASMTMKTTPSARTGRPFASATCGSIDANSRGRAIEHNTATSTAVNIA